MWKEPHLTQIRQKKKKLKSQGEEGRIWDQGPQDWIIKTHSAGCLQLLDHPGALVGGLENHGVWSQRATAETGCIWNEEGA